MQDNAQQFFELAQATIQSNQWRVGTTFYNGTIFRISTVEAAEEWGPGFIRITAREVTARLRKFGPKVEFILHADKEFEQVTDTWTKLNARELRKLLRGKQYG